MTDGRCPAVSLIVLNWNGQAFLESCLTSLLEQDYPLTEVILVDNGSTDNSVAYVERSFPSVKIIETGRNLGFAGGMNTGISSSTGDIVILLNNDTIVYRDWLARLVECMQADYRIGIAGCKVFFSDGVTLQHAGGFVSYPLGFAHHYGYREQDKGRLDTITDVPYVTGAAMAIRRSLLNVIRGLDASYFFYYEDVDICYRARSAGWRVVITPKSSLVHLESATIVRDSYSYLLCFHKSRMRFLLKHLEPRAYIEDFIPGELAWIPGVGSPKERSALKRAYKSALRMLPEVYGQQLGYNADTFAMVQAAAEALRALHAQVGRGGRR